MKKMLLLFLAFAVVVVTAPLVAMNLSVISNRTTVSVMLSSGYIEELEVEDYVLRALAARESEVVALEAKKAFAVTVRSMCMYFITFGCKHNEFDCCDDGDCCIDLAPIANASEGTLNAVHETEGQYLELDGAPAMALFTLCASCGTRQSAEFPYLVPIDTGERCDIHKTEKEFTAKEVFSIFPEIKDDLKFYAVYDESEKLDFAILNNRRLDGELLVTALGMKSVEMTIDGIEDGIRVTSYGVGHGMGLDLCNAERLANGGAYYKKILEFYFPLLKIKEK